MKDYAGKYFSILGDSISTLDGYSEPRYATFYTGMAKVESDVYSPADTWWGRVIDRLGGRLLVNNSFSGSMVIKHPACEIESYACSDERLDALSRDGIQPDVIIVFMGTNDWGNGARIYPSDTDMTDLSVFSVAYERMLTGLRTRYPGAEIWCLTLPVGTRKCREDFRFPYTYGGRHISEYCDAIRKCVISHGCRIIDLYASGALHDTLDGFHPTADGMMTIADTVIDLLCSHPTEK